jgi:hypothetical protein
MLPPLLAPPIGKLRRVIAFARLRRILFEFVVVVDDRDDGSEVRKQLRFDPSERLRPLSPAAHVDQATRQLGVDVTHPCDERDHRQHENSANRSDSIVFSIRRRDVLDVPLPSRVSQARQSDQKSRATTSRASSRLQRCRRTSRDVGNLTIEWPSHA